MVMVQQPEAPFDGRATNIVAASTSVTVTPEVEGKVFKITRFFASNHNAVAARVRFWDSFTDSDGLVHDATTNPVLLADYNVQPNETVDMESAVGLAKAIGAVIARSTVGAADPNDVAVGAFGLYEA